MKKLLYASFIVLLLATCIQKQTTFSIEIEIDSISKGDIIYLYAQKEKSWEKIDTVIFEGKNIVFSGSVKKPELQYIESVYKV
jgi:hypothetical protein